MSSDQKSIRAEDNAIGDEMNPWAEPATAPATKWTCSAFGSSNSLETWPCTPKMTALISARLARGEDIPTIIGHF